MFRWITRFFRKVDDPPEQTPGWFANAKYRTPTGYISNVPIPDKPEEFNAGRFDGTCPDCGDNEWFEGPSGGMSTNIKCAKCGLWLNHTPVLGLAERIGRK